MCWLGGCDRGQVFFVVMVERTNLVEGRELYLPLVGNNAASGGVAIDTDARIVYVADTGNNRVLGWNYIDSLGLTGA